MNDQRPGNEGIQMGSILAIVPKENTAAPNIYYQVVGLQGKTLVELREIRTEE